MDAAAAEGGARSMSARLETAPTGARVGCPRGLRESRVLCLRG